MSFKILGRPSGGTVEEIDTAESATEADYLVLEYMVAFGKGWTIWSVRSK